MNCEHPIKYIENMGYAESYERFLFWCGKCEAIGRLTKAMDTGCMSAIKWQNIKAETAPIL